MNVLPIWQKQFWQSIKSIDTEDKIDLYFFRPLGFVLAKLGGLLGLTPTQLTLLGMICGILSGFLFYQNELNEYLVLASVLFVLAGIFDSADGQLARLTQNFSRIGLVLDGVCDNIVFAAAYIGCVLTILPLYGWKIWILAILAGVCHSAQSAILDFYNREYLYFGCGFTAGDYWNPSVEEAISKNSESKWEKMAWWLRRSWLMQQQLLSTRTIREREEWRSILNRNRDFSSLYRRHNRLVLRLWRPLGANIHTIMIIAFAFLRRFDLYLLLIDIGALTIWFFLVRSIQARSDERFRQQLQRFLGEK